ncbi:hypothetical protein L1987_46397 [Smallanthus sonchifolius]|uniref:Uncharacterized protein n=1 Tax=Smallanthus sonchifolius TaxID=185202 RepID=A0ACB9G0K3_9ASTR|nr:hypothetical protein L1987_46397 [Smallanthus sonchifolius]
MRLHPSSISTPGTSHSAFSTGHRRCTTPVATTAAVIAVSRHLPYPVYHLLRAPSWSPSSSSGSPKQTTVSPALLPAAHHQASPPCPAILTSWIIERTRLTKSFTSVLVRLCGSPAAEHGKKKKENPCGCYNNLPKDKQLKISAKPISTSTPPQSSILFVINLRCNNGAKSNQKPTTEKTSRRLHHLHREKKETQDDNDDDEDEDEDEVIRFRVGLEDGDATVDVVVAVVATALDVMEMEISWLLHLKKRGL